jgi:hypothetical protein
MKVLVVYYTVYGHTLQLARAVEEGVKSVAGVEAVFRRAREFPHTEKELEAGEGYATKIWKEQKDIPVCTLDDLREAKNYSVSRLQARLLTGKNVGITLSVSGEPKRSPQGSKRSITLLD